MSDNDAGLSIIYTGGYVPDLAICIDPTQRFYGWLLARNPLDGRWVSLTKLDFNTATLHEALYTLRARIAELEAELETERWRREECDALRAVVREFVQLEDDEHELAQERLYGLPHTPAYTERELNYRQRRVEFVRRARAALDAARAKEPKA